MFSKECDRVNDGACMAVGGEAAEEADRGVGAKVEGPAALAGDVEVVGIDEAGCWTGVCGGC